MALVYVIAGLLSIPLWGWVLSAFWGWFVVPVFALPSLSIWQAVGLSMFASALRYKLGPTSDRDDSYWTYCTVETFVMPFVLLGFGRLYAGFIGVA